MKIIDCKELKNKQIPGIKQYVKNSGSRSLAIVQVLGDAASDTYTKNKVKLGTELGLKVEHFTFKKDIEVYNLQYELENICKFYDGVILQLPLPKHLQKYEQQLLDTIPFDKDVDCLSTHSIGLLHSGRAKYFPCTAKAVLDVLDEYQYDLDGKDVLIIGRQQLLGYPLFRMMTDRNATCTLAHSHTKGLQGLLSQGRYDVVVSAIGKPKFLENISTDFIIDVGINRDENGKLCGDINLDSCDFEYATTVGGGIGGLGQLTVLNLCKGVIYNGNNY